MLESFLANGTEGILSLALGCLVCFCLVFSSKK